MRLFFAVNFSEDVKSRLAALQNELKAYTTGGNFTLHDNLHLTLVFIGEAHGSRVGQLKQIAQDLTVEPFQLYLSGLGCFKRDGGDILWLGVEENKQLTELYETLSERVRRAGFQIEKRRFTPHLTLVRGAKLLPDFSLRAYTERMDPIKTAVIKASLMKSERVEGRLTYTEIS